MAEYTFYAKIHDLADEIIASDDSADVYCPDYGRFSVPPEKATKVLILQGHEDLLDREGLKIVCLNIARKCVSNVPSNYL